MLIIVSAEPRRNEIEFSSDADKRHLKKGLLKTDHVVKPEVNKGVSSKHSPGTIEEPASFN